MADIPTLYEIVQILHNQSPKWILHLKVVRNEILHMSLVYLLYKKSELTTAAIFDLCKLWLSCAASSCVSYLNKSTTWPKYPILPKNLEFSFYELPNQIHYVNNPKLTVWTRRKRFSKIPLYRKLLKAYMWSAGGSVWLGIWTISCEMEKLNSHCKFQPKCPFGCRAINLFCRCIWICYPCYLKEHFEVGHYNSRN